MDFAAFSDAEFNAKQWVNTALKNRKESESMDTHASGIVMKLQMFIEEVNKSLESTSLQVVQDMPRVIRSVDMVHQEVQSLKDRITSLSDEIAKIESDTANSMATLMKFDEVKSRMEATSSALQEADNWETLSADVDVGFETDDLNKVSVALLGLQRSLMVLTTVPDYVERQHRLAALQDKLENALSPKLLTAFASHDTETAKECVQTFTDMNRTSNVYTYYYRCHTDAAQRKWNDLCKSTSETLTTTLKLYYSDLTTVVETELQWGVKVFGANLSETITQLLLQILRARMPSMSEVLKEDLGSGPDQLKQLLLAFKETCSFSEALANSSINLDAPLFDPFAEYQRRFKTLLTAELQHTLKPFVVGESLANCTSQIKDSLPDVFQHLDGAVTSCFEFTAGTAISGLTSCINEHLAEYAKRLQDIVPHLNGIASKLVEASLDADEEDSWSASRSLFQLIEICGQLFTQIDDFEAKLLDRFGEALNTASGKDESMDLPKQGALHLDPSRSWENEIRIQIAEVGSKPLKTSQPGFQQFNLLLHKLTFDILLSPLIHLLESMEASPEWTEVGDDDFSVSPLPYITQVGEQLLTLPQQLEPFTAEGTADQLLICLMRGNLPEELKCENEMESSADHWLESLSTALAHSYIKHIKTISKLSPKGILQLCADIEYFANVLSALEVDPPAELEQISSLLATDDAELEGKLAATPNSWVASVRSF